MYSIITHNYADEMKVSCIWVQRSWWFPGGVRKPHGWMGQFGIVGFRWDYDRKPRFWWTLNVWGMDFNHDLTWTWPWVRRQFTEQYPWMDWSVGGFYSLRGWRKFWKGYYEDMIERVFNEEDERESTGAF